MIALRYLCFTLGVVGWAAGIEYSHHVWVVFLIIMLCWPLMFFGLSGQFGGWPKREV